MTTQIAGSPPWILFILVPIITFWLVAIFFLPVLFTTQNVNPRELGKVVYSHIMLSCGALLVMASAFLLLLSLFTGSWNSLGTHVTLFVLLAGGLILIITHRSLNWVFTYN